MNRKILCLLLLGTFAFATMSSAVFFGLVNAREGVNKVVSGK